MEHDETAIEPVPSRAETTIKAILNLVPWVGGSIATVYEDYMDRRRERLRHTVTAAAERLGDDGAHRLVDRLSSDERFADLFWGAIEEASKSAVEAKRAAIGHALADASGESETEIDEYTLLVEALSDLDLPHLRTLQRINRFEQDRSMMNSLVSATPDPVLAALVRHGLIIENEAYDGREVGGLSSFGVRLLRYVEGSGATLPPE